MTGRPILVMAGGTGGHVYPALAVARAQLEAAIEVAKDALADHQTWLEEELLPHQNSLEDDGEHEERRLFYVGITRAKQTLTLTLAQRRKQFGDAVTTTPSRFLDELPQQDLQREGFGDVDPERNAARGKETIASLKGLLADL